MTSVADGSVHRCENPARALEEQLTCGKESNAPRGPLEQRRTDLVFEAPDRARDGRLCDAKTPGCAGDVLLFGDGDEVPDLGEAHERQRTTQRDTE